MSMFNEIIDQVLEGQNQRKSLKSTLAWLTQHGAQVEYFDFPGYGGVPEIHSSRLSPDEVDAIQQYWDLLRKGHTRAFREAVLDAVASWEDD